jgi:hypothetical protein
MTEPKLTLECHLAGGECLISVTMYVCNHISDENIKKKISPHLRVTTFTYRNF